MPQTSTHNARSRSRRFIRRIHRMRMLGTALCALPVASVLAERGASPLVWCLLVVNALVWPQLATCLSLRARDPVAAQFRCLAVDSAASGIWIAMMAVSGVPSALFATVATADKVAAGGWALLRRATLALALGFLVTWTLLGFPFEPVSSARTQLASLPFLCVYSVVLSVVTHRLGRRIADQKRELQRISRTDRTVQVPNRPHFEEVAAAELERFHRSGRPAALLLLDVDHFKGINDRHGHGTGDMVLRRIAGVLRRNVRGADLPARYGGDEFALLLVDADRARAVEVAERIRAEAQRQSFDEVPDLRCTLSIGVAAATAQDASLDSWVRAADGAVSRQARRPQPGRRGLSQGRGAANSTSTGKWSDTWRPSTGASSVRTRRACSPRESTQSMRRPGVPVNPWKVPSAPSRRGACSQASSSTAVSLRWTSPSGVSLKSPSTIAGTSACAPIRLRISAAPRRRACTSSGRYGRWVLNRYRRRPSARRSNRPQLAMRGYGWPQLMLPGTCGVSDSQKCPESSRRQASRR